MRLPLILVALTATATLAMAATPAMALTAVQVGAEVAGYHCAGSTCTLKTNAAIATTVQIAPATAAHPADHGDGVCRPFSYNPNGLHNPDGSPYCVQIGALEISGMSGSPEIDSTTSTPVCTTTTKTLGFDPTGGANGFSVSTAVAQSAGNCPAH